jgi:hypothetical protein
MAVVPEDYDAEQAFFKIKAYVISEVVAFQKYALALARGEPRSSSSAVALVACILNKISDASRTYNQRMAKAVKRTNNFAVFEHINMSRIQYIWGKFSEALELDSAEWEHSATSDAHDSDDEHELANKQATAEARIEVLDILTAYQERCTKSLCDYAILMTKTGAAFVVPSPT